MWWSYLVDHSYRVDYNYNAKGLFPFSECAVWTSYHWMPVVAWVSWPHPLPSSIVCVAAHFHVWALSTSWICPSPERSYVGRPHSLIFLSVKIPPTLPISIDYLVYGSATIWVHLAVRCSPSSEQQPMSVHLQAKLWINLKSTSNIECFIKAPWWGLRVLTAEPVSMTGCENRLCVVQRDWVMHIILFGDGDWFSLVFGDVG